MSLFVLILSGHIFFFIINISFFSLHLGPRYPDKSRVSYTPGPYVGPPCEPTRLPGQGWRFPPRTMNHRNAMPYRPPFEGPIPVEGRGVLFVFGTFI
jgi:hypothetical protein